MKIINPTAVVLHSKTKNYFDFKTNLLIEKDKIINDIVYDDHVYSIFVRKNFIKRPKGSPIVLKKATSLFLQSCLKHGYKMKMLNFLNKVTSDFYFLFFKKNDFLLKRFHTYDIFYNFSKTERKFFDINFLFELVVRKNNALFVSKAIRLNKSGKQRENSRAKYKLDLQYIKPERRIHYILKQLHLYANNYNYYVYNERLLMSFLNSFFLEKDSDMYKQKISTYQKVLKKNSK